MQELNEVCNPLEDVMPGRKRSNVNGKKCRILVLDKRRSRADVHEPILD